MRKLTEKECEEIYYALWTKRAKIRQGEYDLPGDPCNDSECRAWVKELSAIIKKIGVDGRVLYETTAQR